MYQESKILMADLEKMGPLARAWHEMHRERIGQEVMVARAASASPPAPSTFMSSPATVDPVAATELPPAADEEVLEVAPPVTSFM
jgi:hypothetical protein